MNFEYFPNIKLGCGIFKDRFDVDPDYYMENFDHLEIQDFVLPSKLDVHSNKIIKGYKKKLKNFNGTLSFHAPIKELFVSSMDTKVRRTAYDRFFKALMCARELGCNLIVVHSCYNPLINYLGYKEDWLENSFYFWDDFLPYCQREQITVAIENIFDRVPDHLIELVKKFDTSSLKVCYDTGHANIFSPLSQEDWLLSLGDFLGHIHIHDNYGEEDDHLPPGQGNVDFSPLSLLLTKKLDVALVCEIQGFAGETKDILEFFGR